MKKRFRIITSLILVTLLVTALATPAIATPATVSNTPNPYFQGSGTWGSMSYSVYVTRDEDSGSASIRLDSGGANLVAKCQNLVYNEDNGAWGYSEPADGAGATYAEAVADNRFIYKKVYLRGTVRQTTGYLYIYGTKVAENTV